MNEDELERLRIILAGYDERLSKEAIAIGLDIGFLKVLVGNTRKVGDGEIFLKIAFGLAISSKYGFNRKNFLSGDEILRRMKIVIGIASIDAITAPQIKSAFEEGLIDSDTFLHAEEKRLARKALEMMGEMERAPC